MNTKKIILSIVFLSSIISSVSIQAMVDVERQQPIQDDKEELVPKLDWYVVGKFNPSHLAILAFFAAACRLYWKDPKPEPDYYDFANLTKFIDPQLLLANPQEYFNNVRDFIDNFIIGQYFKDKYMKMKADGTIKQSKKCPMSGIGGYTASVFQTTEKSQKFLKNIFKLVTTLTAFELAKKGGLFTNMSLFALDNEKPAGGRFTSYQEKKLEALQNLNKTWTDMIAKGSVPQPSAPRASRVEDSKEETPV